jgi:hypothetical protein
VRKTIKARVAVIASHAAIAQAAEGEIIPDHVDNGVVDADTAGPRPGQRALLNGTVGGEQVQRQRRGKVGQSPQGLLEIVKFNHRQNRSKYLFTQDGLICRDVGDDGRSNVQIAGIGLSANMDLPAGKIFRETVEMPAIDDPAKIRAQLRIVTKELDQRRSQLIQKCVADAAVDQREIGSDTRLPGVHEFPPRDSASGKLQRRIRTHDAR